MVGNHGGVSDCGEEEGETHNFLLRPPSPALNCTRSCPSVVRCCRCSSHDHGPSFPPCRCFHSPTLFLLVSHVSPSATSSDPSKGQHQAHSGQRTRWMGPRAPCHCSSPPSERVSIGPPAQPQGARALQAGRADR